MNQTLDEFIDDLELDDDFDRKAAKKAYNSHNTKAIQNVIRKIESLKQYKVGDNLVRRKWGSDYATMGDGTTKIKFKVIHKSVEGIIFAKKYLQDGQLGKQVFNLNADSHTYEIDPDLVDHILLDEEENYDVAESIKKMAVRKKDLIAKNRATAIKWNIKADRLKFFEDFDIGDRFWQSYGFMGQNQREWEITKKTNNTVVMKQVGQVGYWGREFTLYKGTSLNFYLWENKPLVLKDMLGGNQ